MRLVRFICAAYWPLLTVLLLVPDPLALFGIRRVPSVSKGMGVHFLCFSVLGFLVLASRLRVQRVLLALLLIGYATATELLQSLVPRRTVEPRDLIENLLGLAAGAIIWWIAQKHPFQRPKGKQ